MTQSKIAGLILACAFVWLTLQAGTFFRVEGLPASYDLPTHFHLAAVQMRDPSAMWDDGWYAGYPTYAYPPLAHRFAAETMKLIGPDTGFKAAVTAVYIASGVVIYAGARIVAVLSPVPAALATLLTVLSPALFRVLLFGQYPSLMGFLFFWATLSVFLCMLRSARHDHRLAALGIGLLAALGSVHLYPVLLLPLFLAPLVLAFPVVHLIRRLGPTVLLGGVLAVLPSIAFLVDFGQFAKAPVPHITRSLEMVSPSGLLEWILSPASLPMVLGLIVVGPSLLSGQRGIWIGVLLVGGLLAYLRDVLPGAVIVLGLAYAVLIALAIRRKPLNESENRPGLYLAAAGALSLWFALGPAGGLARFAPFANVLVFDRSLLFGAPLGVFAVVRALWRGPVAGPRRRLLYVGVVVSGLMLLGLSIQQVVGQYSRIVPGAQGAFPQGTVIPASVREFFRMERGDGRILPLGLYPVAYTLPERTGRPLIDGAYNDARQLPPLRRSGLETLGYEKFTYADLPVTRWFLANAKAYGIRWVVTGDRYYDQVIPLDRFELVYETEGDPDRTLRIYRLLNPPVPAWEGSMTRAVTDVILVPIARLGPIHIGGGMESVKRSDKGSLVSFTMIGSTSHGWAFFDLDLSGIGDSCNQIEFQAWSPTGASMAVRTQRDGTWLLTRRETPLSLRPAWLTVAVDCQEVSRLRFEFTGSGFHQVLISSVILGGTQDRTPVVPFERKGPECFRAVIPRSAVPVTVSVAAFPRWNRLDPNATLRTGTDELGLLTLEGPAGVHDVCLAFPRAFRLARSLLPGVYVAFTLLLLGLPLLGRFLIPAALGKTGARRISSILTTVREMTLRRRVRPEQAWDFRARAAPDWYISYSDSPGESEESARADLEEILDGVDRASLRSWTMLEIGCGAGRLLKPLAGLAREVYGVDNSAEMIRLAHDRLAGVPHAFALKNDGTTLPMFADGTFDCVFSFAVFQHIPARGQIEAYLREICRVLKPGGEVRLQVDGRGENVLWRAIKRIIGNDSWTGVFFTRRELLAMMQAHGYRVARCQHTASRGHWPGQHLWVHATTPLFRNAGSRSSRAS